ncbi:hypothetical protein J6590_006412 [Homalodisca vitripennis]|nr:hypothetical protein J6590_006412 [Homalodisca vitripennis]
MFQDIITQVNTLYSQPSLPTREGMKARGRDVSDPLSLPERRRKHIVALYQTLSPDQRGDESTWSRCIRPSLPTREAMKAIN